MMKLGGRVMGSMSLPSSTVTRKPVPDKFPAGLRVLVVDDDPTCLTILEKMLRSCKYVVSKTNRAEVALNLLRENQNGFDVVLSDVHMPDMDGFKLLEHVGLEMDLPVIMMSADDSNHVVMKGVTHGACDYLIKPVRIEALKNIWQHVVRKKKKNEWKEAEQSSSWDEGDRRQRQDDAVSSPANEGSWKSSKRKSEDEDPDEKDDTTTQKKPRVVWSVELHQQFVAAVNQLGIDKAVPKKILELMNVPGLTRENVASHLQKYRLYLKRLSEASQFQGGFDSSFMSQDSGLSAMSSISGMDIHALHATGQLSGQTLAAYTRLPLIGPSMSMPFIDQRNMFSFENAKPRYGDPQQQPQSSNSSKEMHLLQGIPTTMEPKQFTGLNQSVQNMGHMNMLANASTSHQSTSSLIKMGPQQSQGLLSNESIGIHASQPLIGQPAQSNGAARTVLTRNGTSGLQGFNQEVNNLGFKPLDGYVGNYEMQINATFGSSSQPSISLSSSVNVIPSVSVNQSRITGNALPGKPMVTSRLDNQHMGMQNINHNVSGIVADDTSRGKAEKHSNIVSSGTNVFSEHYSQDDLMCTVLKQVRN